jgi:hypothetical protein
LPGKTWVKLKWSNLEVDFSVFYDGRGHGHHC